MHLFDNFSKDVSIRCLSCLFLTKIKISISLSDFSEPFIKEPNQTVDDLLRAGVQKFGERIMVGRFARFDAKEDLIL